MPGTVAGLALAHAKYGSGKFTLAELIAPAIALARDGIPVEDDVADSLPRARPRLARWPASAKIFLKPDGSALAPGDMLVQRDLADTLAAIARDGPRAFYEGPIAERIAAAVQAAGGMMTRDGSRGLCADRARAGARQLSRPRDHLDAAVVVGRRDPDRDAQHPGRLSGPRRRQRQAGASDDRGDEARLCGPRAVPRRSGEREHAAGEPHVQGLRRAAARAASIPQRARPSADIRPGSALREGDNTTHFSVVDRLGNAVSNTYTLNFSYGVGLVAEGTGILLNNELDDFAAKPGVPNAYGLIGGDANAPGPGKRPLSSMSPTIVLKDGKPFLVTGSPGGSRIITTVLQVISNVIDRGMPIAEAVAEPRLHAQWSPEEVFVERGDFLPICVARPRKRSRPQAGAAAARHLGQLDPAHPQGLVGAADGRTRGALAAGH